eukprot:1296885-Rhodomonas_salina.2
MTRFLIPAFVVAQLKTSQHLALPPAPPPENLPGSLITNVSAAQVNFMQLLALPGSSQLGKNKIGVEAASHLAGALGECKVLTCTPPAHCTPPPADPLLHR